MKYFRVKYGFGKDDFYSVEEGDVMKAIKAQVNGSIFITQDGETVAGNNIISIAPDYNRVLGVNRDYSLSGEDYALLGTKAVKEHRIFLQEAKYAAIGGSQPKQLEHGR